MELEVGVTVQNAVTFYNTFFVNNLEQPDDDDDSTDEEIVELFVNQVATRVRKEKNVPARIKHFYDQTVQLMSEKEFQSHFRMTRQAFEWLHEVILVHLKSQREFGRQTIEPRKQILAVLWLLATPDSYRSVGCRFDMGKSTLFARFVIVITALNHIAPQLISWPRGATAQRVNDGFFASAGLRGVIGAIDGTYIPIKAPKENSEAYINRKCFHGMTLQAICDHNRRFTDCFTGFPSSVSDVRIFRNSDIYGHFTNNQNYYFKNNSFIIGDKAYPVTTWCIPPYIDRGRLQPWQINFNKCHAKARQVVERSFALLFGRFRRLRYLDMNRLNLIPCTIIAACVLHNICLDHPDDLLNIYEEEGRQFVCDENPDDVNVEEGDFPVFACDGINRRDEIAQNLCRI